MIDDEQLISALSAARGQPDLAFVHLERMFRTTLNQLLGEIEHQDGVQAANSYYIQYINLTIAAAKAFNLKILENWSVPSFESDYSLEAKYRDFAADVDHYSLQVRLIHAQHTSRYSVALGDTDKRKIRHYCEQIKVLIDKSTLDVERREVLLDRLNAFLKELDRERTRMEVFSDLLIGVAHAFGEAANELEPVKNLIVSIARAIGLSKEKEDAAPKLPPSRTKQIEGPKRDAPPKGRGRATASSDDEIPF